MQQVLDRLCSAGLDGSRKGPPHQRRDLPAPDDVEARFKRLTNNREFLRRLFRNEPDLDLLLRWANDDISGPQFGMLLDLHRINALRWVIRWLSARFEEWSESMALTAWKLLPTKGLVTLAPLTGEALALSERWLVPLAGLQARWSGFAPMSVIRTFIEDHQSILFIEEGVYLHLWYDPSERTTWLYIVRIFEDMTAASVVADESHQECILHVLPPRDHQDDIRKVA